MWTFMKSLYDNVSRPFLIKLKYISHHLKNNTTYKLKMLIIWFFFWGGGLVVPIAVSVNHYSVITKYANCNLRTYRQACFRCPGPPYLIMSWQGKQFRQFFEVQPSHEPHLDDLTLATKRPDDIPEKLNFSTQIRTNGIWMVQSRSV